MPRLRQCVALRSFAERKATLLLLFLIGGCSNSPLPSKVIPATNSQSAIVSAADDEPLLTMDPEEIERDLHKLPDELRAAAVQQKICPVTSQLLGSMGVPVTVEHKDRRLFLCCKHCNLIFRKYPQRYISRLAGPDNPPPPPEAQTLD